MEVPPRKFCCGTAVPTPGALVGSAPVWTRLGDRHHNTTAFRSPNTKINRPTCNQSALAGIRCKKRSYCMVKLAIWATVQAKPGKEAQVEAFLKSAQSLAEAESQTVTWCAVKMGGWRLGRLDTFQKEAGREAHLSGEIDKALMANAKELLSEDPQIHKIEV